MKTFTVNLANREARETPYLPGSFFEYADVEGKSFSEIAQRLRQVFPYSQTRVHFIDNSQLGYLDLGYHLYDPLWATQPVDASVLYRVDVENLPFE